MSVINKRVLVLAGALLLVGLGWAWWAASRAPAPLVLYGNVDIRQVSLGFRVGGRLQSLAFDEGDRVPPGAVLAYLDPEPYQHALNQAEAAVAAQQARVDQMKAGYRPEEVAQAQAQVVQRQAALQDAEAALVRQNALRGTGATAAHSYDDALAARDQARALLAAAEAQAQQYRRGYRKEDREAALAQLQQAQAALASARLQLNDTRLKAPQGGVVLTRAAEPGTILAPGAILFTLSLNSPVWVRAYVAEPDLGRVAPGTAVYVYTDGRPDKPYQGVVGSVSPSAEFTPKNVETPDLRTGLVYRLRVVVSDADSGLRQGMPVTVRLARAP
ncbi:MULTISPECIES: secretion protein HlyD [unclassified Paludibacterium]|uniref:secretion protein HlyD n=1 Tax=unclassified Paludibacterium TaxID=2618429 RepID=UPI001C059839|nr:secretion protein HlyD [Paludibacterium sp. B53371]BEV70925.1 secretion protein HlyD [Paludibacterium sp. THUN1379]